MSFIKKHANKLKVAMYALVATLGLGAMNAYAAVDPDIASTTQAMTATVKNNLLGVLYANIGQIVIVGVAVLAIFFVWKLFRRFIGR